jgi:hypothetical protein
MKNKLSEININYMGRNTTLGTLCKYTLKSVNKLTDLSQIGAVVYILKIIENMDFDYNSVDETMEYAQNNIDEMNFIAVRLVKMLKLKEVDEKFTSIILENDEDKKYTFLHKFASQVCKY